MRVGIFIDNFVAGGVDSVILSTILEWPEPNDSFVIVFNRGSDGVESILKKRLPYLDYISYRPNLFDYLHFKHPHLWKFVRFFSYIGRPLDALISYHSIKRAIITSRIDSIIIHNGGFPGGICTFPALNISNNSLINKTLYVIHGQPGALRKRNYLQDTIFDTLLSGAKKVVVVSNDIKYRMNNYRRRKFNINVIPNGVVDQFALKNSGHASSDLGQQRLLRLCILARLCPDKGHHILLHALAQVAIDCPGHKLVLSICGKGAEGYEQYLKDCAKNLGIQDNVRFHGFVSDVSMFLRLSDWLVSPSIKTEGSPMVVLESLSASVPVIVTDVGGCADIVANSNAGILVAPNDIDSLVCAIKNVLVEDQSRYLERKRSARELYLNKYTSSRMARDYYNLLNS